jgi:hypothetical protein
MQLKFAYSISVLFFRFTSPECDMERENIYGNSSGLPTPVGGSQMGPTKVWTFLFLNHGIMGAQIKGIFDYHAKLPRGWFLV